MLAVDLLGEGFPQVVEEIVDDFLLLLQGDEFLLELVLEDAAEAQFSPQVKRANHDHEARRHVKYQAEASCIRYELLIPFRYAHD